MPPHCTARARGLQRLRSEGLALQFGGAAGTLAALGDKGISRRRKNWRRS
jgi:adenylosuccinate lyase